MAQVACSPLTWGAVLYEHYLDDVAGAGFGGAEAHTAAIDTFDRQPGRLRALLDERTLALSGAHFAGTYFDRELWPEELERLRRLAGIMAEASSGGTVVFRTVPHPARRDMVAGPPPLLPLDSNRMGYLAETLNRYCDLCNSFGVKGAIANRVGSYLETPDELEVALELTEPGLVDFAPDVGHWAYAGGDPVALVRAHRQRLTYPRLKDFDRAVYQRTVEERLGFASFVRAGGFKELGAGDLDLEGTLMPLENAEYAGWVCVELQMTEHIPRESATLSREWLREHLHW
jgi:inosose dehydratase